ncbi:MAG: hypothetical protein MSL26_03555 [Clostridiales bacterium]|nr:hypothetical protein [Clostridiales bacterium]
MTDKELKRLSRAELLEMLIEKSREIEALREQLDDALAQLNDRALRIENAGTMAEAALLVNGVLDAAQQAGAQYQENMRLRQSQMEEECARIEAESREEAGQMLAQTQQQCRQIEQDTRRRCEEIRQSAEHEAGRKWDDLFAAIEQIHTENDQLRQMIEERIKKKRKWGL